MLWNLGEHGKTIVVLEELVEAEVCIVFANEEDGATFEVILNDRNIVAKILCNAWRIAIAKDEVRQAGNHDHEHDDDNWRSTNKVCVWVFWEERMPLVDDGFEAGCAEYGNRNDNRNCDVLVEASDNNGKDCEEANDGVSRSKELANGGERAKDYEYDSGETEEWREVDAVVGETKAKEWRKGIGNIVNVGAEAKILHKEERAK